MNIPPGALIFIVFGIIDIAAGLWAYMGTLEAYGAPKGFRNMARSWHGRGSVCAAIPGGLFFLMLGLSTAVEGETLRRLFLYLAGISLLSAVFFLLRAPAGVQPAWMRAAVAASHAAATPATAAKADSEPEPETPQV
ncbi:MAG: hypothetical protein M3O87_08460 [Candidatus Dormibacteraeota bacterium]|nr:hypothetical protein [Candidatus Dormibacteraeota bacterium]